MTRPPVRVVTHPKPLLARLARDDTDDRGPIVGVGAVALALVGAAPGRVMWIAMGRAVFPRRSDTTRPPPRWCPPSPRWVRWRSAESGGAAGAYGAVCATGPARAPDGPSAPPWQPPQQQHQRGRSLPRCVEDRAGQQGVVAVTRAATVGREGALRPEEAPLTAMAVRAGEPIGRQVTLQPDEADAVIQAFCAREINHLSIRPYSAR